GHGRTGERGEPLAESRIGEVAQKARPAVRAHAVGVGRVAEQRDDTADQRVAVVWIDEQAGYAVVDDLGRCAARGDARTRRAHRFDEDEAEALVPAGHHKRGAALVLTIER